MSQANVGDIIVSPQSSVLTAQLGRQSTKTETAHRITPYSKYPRSLDGSQKRHLDSDEVERHQDRAASAYGLRESCPKEHKDSKAAFVGVLELRNSRPK